MAHPEEPLTTEQKLAAYASVEAKLDEFFAKYPGLGVTAVQATLNSFLKDAFPLWHFVGFYNVKEEGKMLEIGAYQGHVLATALIAFGKGQCGACAATQTTQIQYDVATCSNYIPCDDVTRSEIVVPTFASHYHDADRGAGEAGAKKLIAVLDIDAPVIGAFDETDKEHLERLLAKYLH